MRELHSPALQLAQSNRGGEIDLSASHCDGQQSAFRSKKILKIPSKIDVLRKGHLKCIYVNK